MPQLALAALVAAVAWLRKVGYMRIRRRDSGWGPCRQDIPARHACPAGQRMAAPLVPSLAPHRLMSSEISPWLCQ